MKSLPDLDCTPLFTITSLFGLADIIIPFFNKAHLMERCLDHLQKSISEEHTVILVDDGSSEVERKKVDSYLETFRMKVKIITHEVNQGYKLAILSGLTLVESSIVLLLNNDTVVTPGFDKKLIRPILENRHIGATAPISNHPTDLYQYREKVSACRPEDVMSFHTQLSTGSIDSTWTIAPYLTGMCLALNYDHFETETLFQKEYIHGYFEDLDLSCRIRSEGYDLIIVEDCLVYHDGHSTYKEKSQSEKSEIVLHNFGIFQNNWGHLPEHEDLLNRMDYAGKVCPL